MNQYQIQIILYLQHHIHHINLLNINHINSQETPTISNLTADYYFISDTTANKIITCTNSVGCQIECNTANSCKGASINTASANWMILKCKGQYSCDGVFVTGPSTQADIYCLSSLGDSCQDATFVLTNTDTVYLECDRQSLDSGSTSSMLLI